MLSASKNLLPQSSHKALQIVPGTLHFPEITHVSLIVVSGIILKVFPEDPILAGIKYCRCS